MMDDFEKDFMSKVRSDGREPVERKSAVPRKPIEKKWLFLAGLVVLLVGAFVAVSIINSSRRDVVDFELELDEDKPYKNPVIGAWRCIGSVDPSGDEDSESEIGEKDGIQLSTSALARMSFMRDGTYIMEESSGDVEGGTYVQSGNRLEMTMLSLSYDGELVEGINEKYEYDLFYTTDGKMALTENDGLRTAYVCE